MERRKLRFAYSNVPNPNNFQIFLVGTFFSLIPIHAAFRIFSPLRRVSSCYFRWRRSPHLRPLAFGPLRSISPLIYILIFDERERENRVNGKSE